MTKIKININVQCKVELTLQGRVELQTKAPVEYKHNFDGNTSILTCSLWKLMHIFGPMLHMGAMEMPFEKNLIEIEWEG